MRKLPLARTEAEWLVELLENCDPAKLGTWRHDLAAEIRELFGMCSLQQELEYKTKPPKTWTTKPPKN